MLSFASRQLWIHPAGSDQEKKAIIKKLNETDERLYIAANLVVANCVNEYWETQDDHIPYLSYQKVIAAIEDQLVDAIKKKVDKDISKQERDALQKTIWELKDKKMEVTRDFQKHELFEECKSKPILKQLATLFPVIPADILLQIVFRITQNFLKELKRIREGTYKMPYFTQGTSMPFSFSNNFAPFDKRGENIYFNWLDGMVFKIEFGKHQEEDRNLIERFVSGKLDFKNLGDSSIKIDKHRERIYLFLVIKEPPAEQTKPLDKSLSLGVDVGYNVPIYWGLSNFKASGKIGDGRVIKAKRAQLDNQRKVIAAKQKEAQSGHGQSRKLEALRNQRKNERSFFTNLNRKFAKELITIALRKGAGVIKLEDCNFDDLQKKEVKRIRDKNIELAKNAQQRSSREKEKDTRTLQQYRFWSYAQLQRFIIQRAEKFGIEVVYIDHRKTSRYCHICKAEGFRPPQANHDLLVFNYLDKKTNNSHDKCAARQDCPLIEKELTWKNKEGRVWKRKHWVIDADKNAAFYIAASQQIVKKL